MGYDLLVAAEYLTQAAITFPSVAGHARDIKFQQDEDFGEADPLFVYIETVRMLLDDEHEDIAPLLENTPSMTLTAYRLAAS